MELSDILYTKANNAAQRVGMGFIKIPFAEFAGSADDVPMSERSLTPMHEAFYSNTGPIVHKWRHYLSIYHRHLEKYRSQPFRLLEIGVYKGGSLLMWRRYFGEAATIYGIDIDESCAAHDGKGGHVRIGSQADPSFLLSVVRQMGGIDVVIDDGSHVAQHQRASFNTLFPMLSENGTYICEDTHSAYWRGYFGGGYRRSSNFIETAKQIIDDLHADFHDHPSSVEGANRTINSVHFYNSMVVIEKEPQPSPIHIKVPANR
jgi:hypothetical protein